MTTRRVAYPQGMHWENTTYNTEFSFSKLHDMVAIHRACTGRTLHATPDSASLNHTTWCYPQRMHWKDTTRQLDIALLTTRHGSYPQGMHWEDTTQPDRVLLTTRHGSYPQGMHWEDTTQPVIALLTTRHGSYPQGIHCEDNLSLIHI